MNYCFFASIAWSSVSVYFGYKNEKYNLKNLSLRVKYCYRYIEGDMTIMGMGHILYCLYISMIIFPYVFEFLSVVN